MTNPNLKTRYDKPRKPVTPKQLKAWMDKHDLTYREAEPILCKGHAHLNMMVKGKRKVSASISDSMKLYDLSKNMC